MQQSSLTTDLAKVSSGDLVASEAKYHSKCLVALYNAARGKTSGGNDVEGESAEVCHAFTVDQPLFAIAKNIQWKWPLDYGEDKFLIMFGGLHIEMQANTADYQDLQSCK